MGKIITLTSGKGGVGKTVVTAALGVELAKRGKRVLLLDGDMGLRNLDLVLGLEDRVLFDVFDVAMGMCFESDAVLHVADGLDFLPASQKYRWEEVSGDAVLTVLEDLRPNYDYILVDSPAGIGKALMYTLDMADEVMVVVEPTRVSLRDADRMSAYLRELEIYHYAMVFNRCVAGGKEGLTLEEMLALLEPDTLAAILPMSSELSAATHQGALATAALGDFGVGIEALGSYVMDGTEVDVDSWQERLKAKPERMTVDRRRMASMWRRGARW